MPGHAIIATDFGNVGLAWSDAGLTALQLPGDDDGRLGLPAERVAAPPERLLPGVELLRRYFAGEAVELSAVPVDFGPIPDFFRALYLEMRRLRWGETVTYGELAARVGTPGAARDVGQAMGRNHLPVVIPCHRVLASGGRVGGFSAPGGARTKLRLLANGTGRPRPRRSPGPARLRLLRLSAAAGRPENRPAARAPDRQCARAARRWARQRRSRRPPAAPAWRTGCAAGSRA